MPGLCGETVINKNKQMGPIVIMIESSQDLNTREAIVGQAMVVP